MKKLKRLLKHFAMLDNQSGIYPSSGISALARALGISAPTVIRGWLDRKKIPAWRVDGVDYLFAELIGDNDGRSTNDKN